MAAEILERVAEQELAHALLSWRYLRWALARGSKRVRRDVARVFARMEQHVGFGASTSLAGCPEQMRAHGYVQLEERRRMAAIVLNDVVRPAPSHFWPPTHRAIRPTFSFERLAKFALHVGASARDG